MPQTTLGNLEGPNLAARLKAAMDSRIAEAGITLEAVAEGLGKSDRQLRAWREGENEPRFAAVEQIDQYFASIGFPGLIMDVMAQRAWDSRQLPLDGTPLPAVARKLLQSAGELKAAHSIEDCLAERGILPHAHIMVLGVDGSIRLTHCGSRMETAPRIKREVFSRDIRELDPKPYGSVIYNQVRPMLQQGAPVLHDIWGPGVRYKRLGVPVDQFFVGLSFGFEVADSFELR